MAAILAVGDPNRHPVALQDQAAPPDPAVLSGPEVAR
jgi:hypothetical protein